MVEVYYYVKSENVADIVDCGLKLSAFHDKEVNIGQEKKQCFSALLNPKDDLDLYRSKSYTCLKIQVDNEKCYVADRFIYDTAQDEKLDMELYYNSIIPIDSYIFGTYRRPECLITTTILEGEAYVLDKRMDSPVIYTNSEELYINNILQEFRERYDAADDYLLYYFFNKLSEMSVLEKYENTENGTAVFKTGAGRSYCVKKPDLDKFLERDGIMELI